MSPTNINLPIMHTIHFFSSREEMSDKRRKKHLTLVFLSHPERPLQDSDVKSIKFARSEKGNHDGELFLFLFGIEHFSHLKLRSGVLKDGNHIEPPAKFFGKYTNYFSHRLLPKKRLKVPSNNGTATTLHPFFKN